MTGVIKGTPLTYVAHALAIVSAILVLFWNIHFRGGIAWEASDKNLIFNLHPVLMVIGFIILGGEAIISYKSLPLTKDVKKIVHLVLHAIALILGIVGICAAFKNHNETGTPNMYSLHSWFGVGVMGLYGVQWIYGFIVFFYPGGSPSLRGDSLPWHVLFGFIVYSLAVANAALGYLEKLTFLESFSKLDKYGSEAFLVNFTAIATVLYGIFVLLTVYAQKKDQEEEGYGTYSPI